MPDLIPIPGFSPEDIKRKARSALDKLRDNYDLVSVTESSSIKPLESTKLVTSFIKHIYELHTVEVCADKWSSELMGLSVLSQFACQNHYENMKSTDSSLSKGGLVGYNIQDIDRLEYHPHSSQNNIVHCNYMLHEEMAISENLSITLQHFDRELDSAEHGENLNVKSIG